MFAILGASGFVGTRFCRYLAAHNRPYFGVSRSDTDIYDVDELARCLQRHSSTFLINCAGYTGKPNVDACERNRAECLMANSVLPGMISRACEQAGIPWGHVSSGCIYTGKPNDRVGFSETDLPNFSFRQNNCSFYAGSKALGEEAIERPDNCYVWRMRLPFDNTAHPRNLLQKLMTYDRLLNAENSLTDLPEFVAACIASIDHKCPFGIYNLTNPGSITTVEITEMLNEFGPIKRSYQFFRDEAEFMAAAAIAPRSNCVLDSSKAVDAGLQLSEVRAAIRNRLENWISTPVAEGSNAG